MTDAVPSSAGRRNQRIIIGLLALVWAGIGTISATVATGIALWHDTPDGPGDAALALVAAAPLLGIAALLAGLVVWVRHRRGRRRRLPLLGAVVASIWAAPYAAMLLTGLDSPTLSLVGLGATAVLLGGGLWLLLGPVPDDFPDAARAALRSGLALALVYALVATIVPDRPVLDRELAGLAVPVVVDALRESGAEVEVDQFGRATAVVDEPEGDPTLIVVAALREAAADAGRGADTVQVTAEDGVTVMVIGDRRVATVTAESAAWLVRLEP